MPNTKKDRFKKMTMVVENADMKTKGEKQTLTTKPQQIRKHINMPKEWADAIKNNYGGTATSYMLTAIKKQLEQDGYI